MFCPGCTTGYLLKQGAYQSKMLLQRKPIDKAIEKGLVAEHRVERLRQVAQIKVFGRQIGLASTHNYETIAPKWTHVITNVSACDPLAFDPVQWWFPIVGRVPYLGYFEKDDAQRKELVWQI